MSAIARQHIHPAIRRDGDLINNSLESTAKESVEGIVINASACFSNYSCPAGMCRLPDLFR